MKEGRGTGLGADYKPWLKISDVPSLGRSHRLRGIKTGRVHHFLSDIEVSLFYLLDWHDAVTDIREQFPLDREETQAIAERAGIKYPVDSHTRVPLVQTTDFLVDYVVAGEHRRMAYAVKPVEALSEKRKAELLELERLYWLARGVPWGIVTNHDILKTLTCLVPECDGASLTRQGEDALWQDYFTAAPVRRRVFEPNSKRRKKAPGPLPSNTA